MDKLTTAQALKLAAEMLRHIRNGGSYSMIDFHEKLAAIEAAESEIE